MLPGNINYLGAISENGIREKIAISQYCNSNKMNKTIGQRIKECRVRMGMTQEELRKVAIEQVKVLAKLHKEMQVKIIKKRVYVLALEIYN